MSDRQRSRSPLAAMVATARMHLTHEQRMRIGQSREAALERRRVTRIREAAVQRRQSKQASIMHHPIGMTENASTVLAPVQAVASPVRAIAEASLDSNSSIGQTCQTHCYCGLPCARRQVMKQGRNHGRFFICCVKGSLDSTKCARFHFEDEPLHDGPKCRCGHPSKQISWGPGVGEGTRSWVCPKPRSSSCSFFGKIDPGPSRAELKAYGINLPWMGPSM